MYQLQVLSHLIDIIYGLSVHNDQDPTIPRKSLHGAGDATRTRITEVLTSLGVQASPRPSGTKD